MTLHEVSTGSDSDRVILNGNLDGPVNRDPVAIAPGTDLTMLEKLHRPSAQECAGHRGFANPKDEERYDR
jgi:hypothetical protein